MGEDDAPEAFWIDFVGGWCSGAAAIIACQPIDTVLTRMQAGRTVVASVGDGAIASVGGGGGGGAFLGARDYARSLVSRHGVASLWRGSSAMIGAVPLQNALLMAGYGYGKRVSERRGRSDMENGIDSPSSVLSHPLTGVFIGGCTGGVVQSFLMSPVELIKVTQQVCARTGVVTAASGVVRGLLSPGGAGSWRGLNATLLRDGMPHGVWFVSYEVAKDYLENNFYGGNGAKERPSSVAVPLLSGAFAATTAWGVGYPFDLIKTRIQASRGRKGIMDTAMELVQESGGRAIPGLYRGFTLKLIRAVPSSAIGFVVYEGVKSELMSCKITS